MRDMAKEARYVGVQPWIEVAPALLISPQKPSNVPKLETIAEEERDDSEEDSVTGLSMDLKF